MKIDTLVKEYQAKVNERGNKWNELLDGMVKKTKEIERLTEEKRMIQKEFDAISQTYPSWMEIVIEPIAKEVAKAIGLEYIIFGIFGKRGQVSIFFVEDKQKLVVNQPSKSLHLMVENVFEGVLYYETGRGIGGHPEPLMEKDDPDGYSREILPLPQDMKEIVPLIRSTEEVVSKPCSGTYQAYIQNVQTKELLKDIKGSYRFTRNALDMLVFNDKQEAEDELELLKDVYEIDCILVVEGQEQ